MLSMIGKCTREREELKRQREHEAWMSDPKNAATIRSWEREAELEARGMPVGPAEVVAAYESNEIAADRRFKGKRLRLTGVVADIGRDILDTAYITIESGNRVRKVQVFFGDEFESDIAKLRRGMTVTVVGRCNGLMLHVMLIDASFE
ncbi:MAG: hypothetical protein IPH13_15420 [Planctomycetes bacterium]|nr:hypothetical protein [Planctomycetota bacterium]MCC7173077.1 hypothetical protein [Planctomycetota bacterium]